MQSGKSVKAAWRVRSGGKGVAGRGPAQAGAKTVRTPGKWEKRGSARCVARGGAPGVTPRETKTLDGCLEEAPCRARQKQDRSQATAEMMVLGPGWRQRRGEDVGF